MGIGLQLSSTRQLSDTTSADFTWVLGPRAAQGAGLSISRRGEKLITSARLDVSAPQQEKGSSEKPHAAQQIGNGVQAYLSDFCSC